MRLRKISCFLTLFGLCVFLCSCIDYREPNIKAVEKLRQELLRERFDEIYDDSSNITRGQLERSEFLERIRSADAVLKSIDPELNWQRVEKSPEPGVYGDENWSSLDLVNGGRKVNIQLDWGEDFSLCGMQISGDIPEPGRRVFRNCD